VEHGGAENVTCGEELETEGANFQGGVKGMRIETFFRHVETGLENMSSGFGAKDVLVPSEVICMSMGNEAILPGAPRIEPEFEVRQVEAVFCLERNWFGHLGNGMQ